MRSTVPLAVLALALSMTSGCYLGRTKSAKTSAYALNGLVAGVGGVIAVSASKGTPQGSIGGALVIGAVIATVITLAVPSEPEAAIDPPPREVALGTVTAPGLTPAIVQIR